VYVIVAVQLKCQLNVFGLKLLCRLSYHKCRLLFGAKKLIATTLIPGIFENNHWPNLRIMSNQEYFHNNWLSAWQPDEAWNVPTCHSR